jgi:hypothetical protein
MTWLIIAGVAAALGALVTAATVGWLKRMDQHHDRAFAEQEERLNRVERSRGARDARFLTWACSSRKSSTAWSLVSAKWRHIGRH